MTRLTLTVGLPASGKSTWARDTAAERRAAGQRTAVVGRDALRDIVGVDRFADTAGEALVTEVQVMLVAFLLRRGVDVIVDDTNLRVDFRRPLEGLGRVVGAEVVVRDFTGAPVEVCVARDARRPPRVPGRASGAAVGAEVIRDLARRYLPS